MFGSNLKPELTEEHKQVLCALEVDESGPGTVLRDFQAMLSFVCERALPVSKKHEVPSLQVLPEMNARLAHPTVVRLKRPQIKSYPHIQGLYLLMRASGLCRIRGMQGQRVLTVDDAAYDSWARLNPTERYFSLLETWLLRGDLGILGEPTSRSGFGGRHFYDCAEFLVRARGGGLPIAGNDSVAWYVHYSPGFCGIALLEQFGFLAIEHGQPQEGQGWQVERASTTPLGGAVFALLLAEIFSDIRKAFDVEDSATEAFGVLQPVFQPYVPEWRNNLSLPAWEFRKGMHVFKVSLGRGVWRQIAVPGRLSLDALANAILDAFEFDWDHLYLFSYRNPFGIEARVHHPYMSERPWTTKVRVGDIPLKVGESMTYLYDFGDNWEFDVTLERVDPADTSGRSAVILEGRGKAPKQYRDWDDVSG